MILELSKSRLKQRIFRDFQDCRESAIALFAGMDAETFCQQIHPDFSPVGWHLGHIAYTESLWILERSAGLPCPFPEYRQLYAADGLPKSQRVKLPSLEETLHYLHTIRSKVLTYLEVTEIESQERLWRFLLQHESQHCETASFVLALIKAQQSKVHHPQSTVDSQEFTEMVKIPAGEFEMGSNSPDALDNERPQHKVYLDTYYIDKYPVTRGQYRQFIQGGGYADSRLWSDFGWYWLKHEQVNQPLYWDDDATMDAHPVCGVSWYEAEAYANFVGKRLPTEAEWEKASSWDRNQGISRIYPWGDDTPSHRYCNHHNHLGGTTPVNYYPEGQSSYGIYDTLGNVWEWTGSWFDGYEGFEFYPYIGYSQVYFDKQHRVLKGGSWVTRPWTMRCSFRNWYHPTTRQLFAGFRCVMS
ncbi:SUMF1/EgtB/PvdO family nonheme iron enzyme [Calothrix sp. 336/3]|uniref:SUMF1/EgtB/PvdO family nonheme iron enzyme n=1 Tax=Calothrix sp. 336/3 TaxID=1337936 RepID=UPI0004E2BB89|nr:SUMF1/EgtB/PvdO family nonheme iron enzyme [Calothrix sp. 336/3]AKG20992.1 hypothetical protein IJ00_06485 [Calothrix sp. 336/3]